MNVSLGIVHLKHAQIDYLKWDALLDSACFSVPYAYSWYLDAVSPGWEALVYGDYEYVMPLPLKQKWGIRYLIEPRFIQQLGVFSKQPCHAELLGSFIKCIPYWSYDFNLNHSNSGPFEPLPNTIIQLNDSIEAIRSRYSKNTIRNLQKAEKLGLRVVTLSSTEFFEIWRIVNANAPSELIERLSDLSSAAQKFGHALYYGVKNASGSVVAVIFMVSQNRRSIFLAPASTPEGKRCFAMFKMVDWLLSEMCEQEGVFDFEGSQLLGVARFYAGFGGLPERYYHIKRLRPSWLVKLLHKG